jgi:DNA polymerase III subunit epsilon
MLPQKIAFVDIETTGSRSTYDRVIEIGILRVEDGILVKTFHSLINPDKYLPPDITMLTGITSKDLEDAPSFYSIKDELLEILDDCVFVAHNVRFDYGFLKNEFKRLDISFTPKQFCTVRLSRALYPECSHHNLDAIIERFGFKIDSRHRAFDDAQVLWDFYQQIQKQFSMDVIEAAVAKAMKRPSIPLHITQETLDKLPETSGVYLFYGDDGALLYVGKSINLRDRILSHFSSDHSSATEMKIAQQIKSIETLQTSGELGALLLEASLIKKLQPLYNRKLRISRKLVVLKRSLNKHGYQSPTLQTLDTINVDELDEVMGIFRSQAQAKRFLIELATEYTLCEKVLGVDHSSGPCFGYRLGRCKGACAQMESSTNYNLRFALAFGKHKLRTWPFAGPIMIEEHNPIEKKKEGFIIDKWCHVANLDLSSKQPKLKPLEGTFDLDAYKILNRYLRTQAKKQQIKVLSQDEIKHLFSL